MSSRRAARQGCASRDAVWISRRVRIRQLRARMRQARALSASMTLVRLHVAVAHDALKPGPAVSYPELHRNSVAGIEVGHEIRSVSELGCDPHAGAVVALIVVPPASILRLCRRSDCKADFTPVTWLTALHFRAPTPQAATGGACAAAYSCAARGPCGWSPPAEGWSRTRWTSTAPSPRSHPSTAPTARRCGLSFGDSAVTTDGDEVTAVSMPA